MANDWQVEAPYYRCKLKGGDELTLLVGDDNPDRLSMPCDITVSRELGGRWSGTVASLDHIAVILERFRTSGECLGGAYLPVPHFIILREVSIEAVLNTVEDLIAGDGLTHALEALVEAEWE